MLATLLHKVRGALVKALGVATKEEVEVLKGRMLDLHMKVWHLYYPHTPYEPYEDDE